ncbi:hypothetical protein QAD02_004366 [Eretmocerus hayati]|uniref:Uncharacterized protein n=1 Tax=Eretmocerus hayati TaxID=131215 RepID=A0ACC2NPD0_9HYME|nr:hypothetical protein QAD02_004366 [Eretmocerus hayati]
MPKFQCPRAFEINHGCFHKGDSITVSQCQELCENFYRNSVLTGYVAVCESNDECKCPLPPYESRFAHGGFNFGLGLTYSLADLEQSHQAQYLHGEYHHNGFSELRCGYRNELISDAECHQLCTDLQRDRGMFPNPWVICRPNSRCKCEDIDEGGAHIFVSLDLLEARYRCQMERGPAFAVRVWIEVHNGGCGLWSGISGLEFRCPRTYELTNENCIYQGMFINQTRCFELCQNIFLIAWHEQVTEAICENHLECKCVRWLSDSNDGVTIRRVKTLSDWETHRAREYYEYDEQPRITTDVRCGYYDGLITSHECHNLCSEFHRSIENVQNPAIICQMHSRCKCEVMDDNDNHFFVNLDTLEAQYYRRIEERIAANVRIWIEMHNQFLGQEDEWMDEVNNQNGLQQ